MAKMRADINTLETKLDDLTTVMDYRLKLVEESTSHMRRMAAVVSFSILALIGFSLMKCRPGTVVVDQVGRHPWRLCSLCQGRIPQLNQYV
jgi:hypothetical protein